MVGGRGVESSDVPLYVLNLKNTGISYLCFNEDLLRKGKRITAAAKITPSPADFMILFFNFVLKCLNIDWGFVEELLNSLA